MANVSAFANSHQISFQVKKMLNWLAKSTNSAGSSLEQSDASDPSTAPFPATDGAACTYGSYAESFLGIVGSLLAAIPHPVLLLDNDGIIELRNPSTSLLGLGSEQGRRVVGESFAHFLGQANLPTSLAGLLQKFPQEERVEKKCANYKVVLQAIRSKGRQIGIFVEFRERSSPESMQRNLDEARRRLQELSSYVEFSSDGLCAMDGETNIVFINRVYEQITGLKRDALIGRSMLDLVAQGVFDRSVGVRVLETRQPATLPLKLSTGRSVLVSANPLFDENNRIYRIICSIRDTTELYRLQNELDCVGVLKTRYEEELLSLKKREVFEDRVIFRSASMQKVVELALRLGSVDSTVLLHGESGVGKEVIADVIQKNSRRRDKPFIKINCAAIPEQLLESELFGYARGAFTGASKEGKAGIFEAAHQGTLLLDEVGDMPLSLQAKLLRAIQEKNVRRIGDSVDRAVDVRILAATHKNLAAMAGSGEFRMDLFYRLNVVPLHIPPLRKRKEDILLMIRSFLHKYCERYDTKKELHPRILPILLEYPWPGNVRELENIIERIVVTSAERVIDLADLPHEISRSAKKTALALPIEGKNLKDIMDHFEAMILRHYFSEYGTTRDVATALGIHQSNIVRKLQRLNLEDVINRKERPEDGDGDKPKKSKERKPRRKNPAAS